MSQTQQKPTSSVNSTGSNTKANPLADLLAKQLGDTAGLLLNGFIASVGNYEEINLPAKEGKPARVMKSRRYKISDGINSFTYTEWDDAAKEEKFQFGEFIKLKVTQANTDKGEMTVSGQFLDI